MSGDSFIYFKKSVNVSNLFYNSYYSEYVKLTFNVNTSKTRVLVLPTMTDRGHFDTCMKTQVIHYLDMV